MVHVICVLIWDGFIEIDLFQDKLHNGVDDKMEIVVKVKNVNELIYIIKGRKQQI